MSVFMVEGSLKDISSEDRPACDLAGPSEFAESGPAAVIRTVVLFNRGAEVVDCYAIQLPDSAMQREKDFVAEAMRMAEIDGHAPRAGELEFLTFPPPL
jgi:hypothetical protein